jgi:hypothetical protein
MRKPIRIITLSVALILTLLLQAGLVRGQVGQDALKYCEEFAFSTEEDFMTQGPEPPDGNPIISDGDLLGPDCVVCARNYDLLAATFDVTQDLGLDAADVIDVEGYLVAFSTELDSPHGDQFTAGDLLVTSIGVIIPNIALTHPFEVGYDIGLDALHFVGDTESIIAFLDAVLEGQMTREYWLANPGELAGMLGEYKIDIWFSTEGTLGTVTAPGFLDGDLLSARDGGIVAPNKDLLPSSVPAGIPDRGVDFGLDAATGNRAEDKEQVHFSTEILYEGELSFTDGDVLKYGNGVVAKNVDLIQCFEPRAKELGLDALSVNIPITRPCVSRITHVAGVAVADIGTDGMAIAGTVGSPAILAPVPFGGWIDIQGSICEDVEHFRVIYRLAGSASLWTPIPVEATRGWTVKVDSIWPGPDCLDTAGWSSGASDWYNAYDYRNLVYPVLGGCNTGLALTVWDSDDAVGGGDELYEVVLETETALGIVSDTVRLVQLDNTVPIAELNRTPDTTCEVYTDMPITVTGRITDAHFYRYRLQLTGDGYGIYSYPDVRYYDDPGDNIIETGTMNWDAFVDLHAVDVHHLDDTPVECGYTVLLTAWERTLWCAFNFPNNQPYHYPGHRHDTDAWTFKYLP